MDAAEKERQLQLRIDAIRRRNEERMARFKEIEADALSASKSQQVKKSSTGGDREHVVTCGGKTVVLSGMHIDDAGNEKRVDEPTTDEADSDWDSPSSAAAQQTSSHAHRSGSSASGSQRRDQWASSSASERQQGRRDFGRTRQRERFSEHPASSDAPLDARQRKENELLRKQRELYDAQRRSRQKTNAGGWKREWDVGKVEDQQKAYSKEVADRQHSSGGVRSFFGPNYNQEHRLAEKNGNTASHDEWDTWGNDPRDSSRTSATVQVNAPIKSSASERGDSSSGSTHHEFSPGCGASSSKQGDNEKPSTREGSHAVKQDDVPKPLSKEETSAEPAASSGVKKKSTFSLADLKSFVEGAVRERSEQTNKLLHAGNVSVRKLPPSL